MREEKRRKIGGRVKMSLTLHVPASPDDVVQSDLVLPPQPDAFEAIPLGRCQLLSGTNSNAHTSYPLRHRTSTSFELARTSTTTAAPRRCYLRVRIIFNARYS